MMEAVAKLASPIRTAAPVSNARVVCLPFHKAVIEFTNHNGPGDDNHALFVCAIQAKPSDLGRWRRVGEWLAQEPLPNSLLW
jgi:hypothetical protein